MGYAVKQDMIDQFGSSELIQLTDRSNTGSIDDTVLNKALANADARINSYLEARYTLPLVTTYPILMLYACDLARYDLYDVQAPLQVVNRYTDAMKFLLLVSQGNLQLGATTPVADIPSGGNAKISANDRVFSRDTLADY